MFKNITIIILFTTIFIGFNCSAHSGEHTKDKDKQAIVKIISGIKYGW